MISMLITPRVVATWQTLRIKKRMDAFKRKFKIADFELVVVDEAHHSVSNEWVVNTDQAELRYLQLLSEFNDGVEIEKSTVAYRAQVHAYRGRDTCKVGG
jgi:type I site-specific restriction endonuclease